MGHLAAVASSERIEQARCRQNDYWPILCYLLSAICHHQEDSKGTLEPIRNHLLERSREASVERSRNVVGVALIYDGSIARALDEPLEKAAAQKSGLPDYRIPTEAEPSEFYLDTVSVDPKCQGRGFGRDLIEASCEHARKLGRNRIGLLVDLGNFAAKRLYERLEFRVESRKQIAGYEYFHMVRDLQLSYG